MSWNYRVIRKRVRRQFSKEQTGGKVLVTKSSEMVYAIHEVYYDGQGKIRGSSQDSITPQGSTLEELRAELVMMLNDTYRFPVMALDLANWKGWPLHGKNNKARELK